MKNKKDKSLAASVPAGSEPALRGDGLEFDNHHRLYNSFVRDLKILCRKPGTGQFGNFRGAVSVKAILDLEQRYAEAETRMFDRAIGRFQSTAAAARPSAPNLTSPSNPNPQGEPA